MGPATALRWLHRGEAARPCPAPRAARAPGYTRTFKYGRSTDGPHGAQANPSGELASAPKPPIATSPAAASCVLAPTDADASSPGCSSVDLGHSATADGPAPPDVNGPAGFINVGRSASRGAEARAGRPARIAFWFEPFSPRSRGARCARFHTFLGSVGPVDPGKGKVVLREAGGGWVTPIFLTPPFSKRLPFRVNRGWGRMAFNSSHVLVNFTYPNHLFTHITPLITQRRHIQVFGHYHKQNSKQNSAQCPKVLAV